MKSEEKINNPDVLEKLENFHKNGIVVSGRQSIGNTYNLLKYLQTLEGEEITGSDGIKRKFKIVGKGLSGLGRCGDTIINEVNELKKIKDKE